MTRIPRLLATPTYAVAAVALSVLIAGCSDGPERDSETGELVEPTEVNVFDLRVGDCKAVLGSFDPDFFDLIYLDPPFFTRKV